jgi:hypothetical protein
MLTRTRRVHHQQRGSLQGAGTGRREVEDIFSAATIENGFSQPSTDIPIYVSHHMHKAATTRLALASGKVDGATPTNGTTGRSWPFVGTSGGSVTSGA